MQDTVKKRLLLVEDEVLISLAEKDSLEKYGYKVELAGNGEKALSFLENDPDIDMVLMDIDLGSGMDGTVTAEKILKKHDLPIVFLTSHDEPEIINRTEKIGSYGLMTKNMNTTILNSSIKMSFRLYEAYRQLRETENRFKMLFENLTDAFAVHEIICDGNMIPEDYRFIEVNHVMLERVNMTREQMIGHTAKELFPKTEKEWIDAFGRVALSGKSEVIARYSVELNRSYEARVYCPQTGYFAALFIDLDEDVRSSARSHVDNR
jgi:DNA-binding response OmpR family regulator